VTPHILRVSIWGTGAAQPQMENSGEMLQVIGVYAPAQHVQQFACRAPKEHVTDFRVRRDGLHSPYPYVMKNIMGRKLYDCVVLDCELSGLERGRELIICIEPHAVATKDSGDIGGGRCRIRAHTSKH
jgi:hypothetical protein